MNVGHLYGLSFTVVFVVVLDLVILDANLHGGTFS
jgi:hypothetical protein